MTARASSSKQTAMVVTPRASVGVQPVGGVAAGPLEVDVDGVDPRLLRQRLGWPSRIACTRASASRSMTVMVVSPSLRRPRRGLDQAAAELPDADDHQVRRRAVRRRRRRAGGRRAAAARRPSRRRRSRTARRRAAVRSDWWRISAQRPASLRCTAARSGPAPGARSRAEMAATTSALVASVPQTTTTSARRRRGRPAIELVAEPRVALDDPALAPAQRRRRRRWTGRPRRRRRRARPRRSAVRDPRCRGRPGRARPSARAAASPATRRSAAARRRRCPRAATPPPPAAPASARSAAASWRCRARG